MINPKSEYRNPKQVQISNVQNSKRFSNFVLRATNLTKLLGLSIAVLFIAVACNKQAAVQPAQNPQAVNSNQKTDNTTANWKIYTNTELGFEVKIPQNWNVDTSHMDRKVVFFIDPSHKAINYDWDISIDQSLYREPKNDTSMYSQFQTKSIGNLNWYKISFKASGFANQHPTYFVDSPDNRVSYEASWNSKTDEQVLVQILSTFKFTK